MLSNTHTHIRITLQLCQMYSYSPMKYFAIFTYEIFWNIHLWNSIRWDEDDNYSSIHKLLPCWSVQLYCGELAPVTDGSWRHFQSLWWVLPVSQDTGWLWPMWLWHCWISTVVSYDPAAQAVTTLSHQHSRKTQVWWAGLHRAGTTRHQHRRHEESWDKRWGRLRSSTELRFQCIQSPAVSDNTDSKLSTDHIHIRYIYPPPDLDPIHWSTSAKYFQDIIRI